MNVKNIIFDLGGVILNIDYQKTIDAFDKLGCRNFSSLYTQQAQHDFFSKLEIGETSPQSFRDQLKESANITASYSEIDEAWNAMLLDLPVERLNLLEELKQKKRIFLLSNTNAIHKKAFDVIVETNHKVNLDTYFEKAYYSHLMGDRKPNTSIFERVLKENGLQAEETLFIDDSEQHLIGAAKVGLQTIHLQKPKTILDLNLL